jgi:hypothetical protein
VQGGLHNEHGGGDVEGLQQQQQQQPEPAPPASEAADFLGLSSSSPSEAQASSASVSPAQNTEGAAAVGALVDLLGMDTDGGDGATDAAPLPSAAPEGQEEPSAQPTAPKRMKPNMTVATSASQLSGPNRLPGVMGSMVRLKVPIPLGRMIMFVQGCRHWPGTCVRPSHVRTFGAHKDTRHQMQDPLIVHSHHTHLHTYTRACNKHAHKFTYTTHNHTRTQPHKLTNIRRWMTLWRGWCARTWAMMAVVVSREAWMARLGNLEAPASLALARVLVLWKGGLMLHQRQFLLRQAKAPAKPQ